ncbi:zinc finger BED domain-containing protein 5-like [Cherax quadricarinatus]|uniref:zinc finger BED domain-containing protein 5-like n=1 Tax=Cherax quadricarinatus TaxID=27406 RepID=UPI00387EE302
MSKKRTYTDAFLRHGFVNLTSGGEDRPQCVACHKVLTNESLKPSKLSAHLQKCHPNLQNKDQAYFQCQAVALKNIQFGSSGIQAQKLQAAVEASYCVAYKIAEQQKCHTIAENLIMPCAYEMVSKVCGEDQAKKLSVISLSNNTIRRRVDDMASDILSQVTTEIKESSYGKFSLQFDESCDVASCAVLLGFVRYVHQDKIKEEFLLCEDLLTTTKGEDVFNIINSFFTKNGLDWNSVQQVSVDGAPSMMGGHRGLRCLIQAINPEISVDHCIIHRYSLGSKSLPGNLKLVFEDVLKIVNFIKSRDVNSRIFKELCKEMGEQYQVLLYHTDVRWLSRGKVVRRVIELRKAVQEFLEQKGSPFATKFTDKEWLARLCYLADIFAELNSGNLQLQGRNTTVIDAHHTVTAFLGKLRLWIRRLEKGVFAQFPTLDQFVEENSHDTGSLLQTINKEMSDHLKGLETSMHHYFPETHAEDIERANRDNEEERGDRSGTAKNNDHIEKEIKGLVEYKTKLEAIYGEITKHKRELEQVAQPAQHISENVKKILEKEVKGVEEYKSKIEDSFAKLTKEKTEIYHLVVLAVEFTVMAKISQGI